MTEHYPQTAIIYFQFDIKSVNLRNVFQFFCSYNCIIERDRTIQMYEPSLEYYPYQNVFERCSRCRDFTELNDVIRRVFSSPETLNDSFKLNAYKASNQTDHNVDFTFINRFFGDVAANAHSSNIILFTSLDSLLKKVEESPDTRGSLTRAFFIILLNPQLYNVSNCELLGRLCLLIHSLPEDRRTILTTWLHDIDTQKLQLLISGIHNYLNQEVQKLLPGPGSEAIDTKSVTTIILAACRLMEVIYKSNEKVPRVSLDSFHNKDIMQYFDPTDQFKLSLKGIKILNFIEYPFLLNLDYKNKLLEIQTRIDHQVSMQKGLLAMMNGVMPEHQNDSPAVINALFLMIQVNRNNILDDSLNKLSKTVMSLKNPLKITFLGEPGDDGGGVKKEYFQLIIKEIFHPHRDMFVPRNNNTNYWFNGHSFEAPIMFEFVGMILGLSIYNTTLLNLKFPRILYKKLLAPENTVFDSLSSLGQIDPDMEASFRYILETDESLEIMEMTFEAETELYGQKIRHQLKPYGNLIQVNQGNKYEYVRLYTDWLINKSIEKQFKAFRKGFYKVVTGNVIKLFSAEELERIICGAETLEFKQLEKACKYEGGYTSDTQVIKWLWEIVENYDLENKKAFLFFVTGTDRAPIGGLSTCKFVIQRHCADSDILPTARTCSSVLLLPEYTTKQKLSSKLELVLQYKEGFGLI